MVSAKSTTNKFNGKWASNGTKIEQKSQQKYEKIFLCVVYFRVSGGGEGEYEAA